MKNIRLLIVIPLLFLIGVVLFVNQTLTKTDAPKSSTENQNVIEKIDENIRGGITPTPFEFNDLTIPYLREKKYESSLVKVQEAGDNAAYKSYIASYESDGFTIYGLLTEPKADSAVDGHPAIIFIHGYIPPKSYRTKVNYASYVDHLATNGFIVFKIDLRGHDQSEGEPGGAYYSGDYVTDALNAYSALENYESVNKNAIGYWGHSMAGNIVFRSLAVKKDVPAAVIWAGAGYTYKDLQDYGIDDNSYRPPDTESPSAKKRQKLRELYGQFDPTHWFWKQVPGTNYLEGVTGNLQLNHAVNDNVVSVDYSRNLVKVLQGSGINTELKEYSSGGHNLSNGAFGEAMQNTVEYFRKYLK